MCEFVEIFHGVIEIVFVIGVAKGHYISGCQQCLFNCPRVDDIMSQSLQKVQPPCVEDVVCEYEAFLHVRP